MAERDTCLVVPASYWFEIHGGSPDPNLEQLEYKFHCRIIAEGSLMLVATVFELADTSGQFRKLMSPRVEKIPKYRVLREEPWDRRP